MQVKTFEAEDMATALKMIKETFGPDALILSTRTLRKGGLRGKPMLEVAAAIETPAPRQETADGRPLLQPAYALAAYSAPPAPPTETRLEREESAAGSWRQSKVIDPLEEEVRNLRRLSALDVDALRGEITELKELVRGVVQGSAAPPTPAPAPKDGSLARMMDLLLARGIEAEIAEVVLRQALAQQPVRARGKNLEPFLAAIIGDLVQVSGPATTPAPGGRKVALVGPTGVGKTTTIAKLAADYLLADRSRRLALVTVDIYRIAAAEQLRVYGEIMNVPVDVVLSPEELAQAFDRHRDKDLVLIDTAGRSPRDEAAIGEMARFLGPGSGVENHLVLAAPTREREMLAALDRFSRLPLHSLIFSKVDECEQLGHLLNVHLKSRVPVSYLTNGQRVPEDLTLAEPRQVAGWIMANS